VLHFSKHNIIMFNVNVYTRKNNSIDFIEIIKNQVECVGPNIHIQIFIDTFIKIKYST